jgi:hypothetical protein
MDRSRVEAFRVLGIPADSDQDLVARAYRRLARVTHPDVSHDPDAADRFATIAAAYQLASHGPPATSVSVRIHESGSGGGGNARARPSVEDLVAWGGPVAGSWTTPVMTLLGGRREQHAPIVAGPARVTPLPGRADTEVCGG